MALEKLYEKALKHGVYKKPHATRWDVLKEHVEFQREVAKEVAISGFDLQGFWDIDGVSE